MTRSRAARGRSGARDGSIVKRFDLVRRATGSGLMFDPNPAAELNDTSLSNDSTTITSIAAHPCLQDLGFGHVVNFAIEIDVHYSSDDDPQDMLGNIRQDGGTRLENCGNRDAVGRRRAETLILAHHHPSRAARACRRAERDPLTFDKAMFGGAEHRPDLHGA